MAREEANAGQLAPLAGLLVAHWLEAGEGSRAAAYADMAARHALTLAAPAEAVAFARQALALDPTPARRAGLGHALVWQGDVAAARAAFEAALRELEARGDREGAEAPSLEELLAGVSPDNLHGEIDTGPAIGQEMW